MSDLLLYLATGAFVGVISGLFGVGGGLIIVPVLFAVFTAQGAPAQYVMHMALATSLATIIITSISSTIAHHRHGAVQWPLVAQLAPGILAGAWLGSGLASALPSNILKPVFGVFELAVALYMFSRVRTRAHQTSLGYVRAIGGGGVIGFISAIVGIGGGTMTVPFLNWHGVRMQQSVATSAAVGFPIAVFATAGYIYRGWNIEGLPESTFSYVHLTAFAMIILTSITLAPVGAGLAHRLPEKKLRMLFAGFLLVLGVRMLLF
jgi:uncharacterized protein